MRLINYTVDLINLRSLSRVVNEYSNPIIIYPIINEALERE